MWKCIFGANITDMSGLARVEKDDEILACMYLSASIRRNQMCNSGQLSLFPLGAPDSIESDQPSFNWLRQFQQKAFFNKELVK